MRTLLLLLGLLLPTLAWSQDAALHTAQQHLRQHAKAFGITGSALAEARVTDAYVSRHTGVTHVYLRQHLDGLDVAGANVNVNVTRDGRVLFAGGAFVPGLEGAARSASPALPAEAAVEAAARHLGLVVTEPVAVRERRGGAAQAAVLSEGGISKEPIPAHLLYVPAGDGVRLAWAVLIHDATRPHVWDLHVDAATGEVLAEVDRVVNDHWGAPEGAAEAPAAPADLAPRAAAPAWHPPMALPAGGAVGLYRVLDLPVESPNFGEHSLVSSPADAVASPLGWHDTGTQQYTITRGNNTYAYADASGTNGPSGTGAIPEGGDLLAFDFDVDFTQHPSQYRAAAVTNLFYWTNLLHDVLYHYGFDEAAGNFQQNNFGNGGLGNDALLAEAQDGSDINNARFYYSADGEPSRIEMYLWNLSNPQRDGDFDNGIITHEFGHGVSIRLTGGPSNVSCLNNSEQMGEGWSDFFGVLLTMEEGDAGEDRRGVGTYALNQPPTGNGIRPAPYSTNFAVNGYTYGNVGSLAVPHGVGFLWATMLWEMTWELVDAHGFDADVHAPGGLAGNQLALQLVMDGLKLQPCNPGFVTGRDAILAADTALTGGANGLYIWRAFAKRGLGYSASQGSSNSTSDGAEAFDMPPGLRRALTLEAAPAPVPNGELAAFTLAFENGAGLDAVDGVALSVALPENARYVPGSATDGGALAGDRVEWPAFDAATNTVTTRSFLVRVEADGETVVYFTDYMEDGGDGWDATHGEGSQNWTLSGTGGHDGSAGWFAADVGSITDQYLALAEPIALTGAAELRFWHRFSTENTYDGGVIEVSTNGGTSWADLGGAITENGYTGSISTGYSSPIGGRQAFTGSSGGWIQTVVDLSAYAGQEVLVRFRFATDSSVSGDGWYVDDFEVMTAPMMVAATACADVAGVACATARALVVEALEGAPALDVSDDAIEVVAEAGGTARAELLVTNPGDRTLDVFAGAEVAWLTGGRLAVEPGEGDVLTVTFDAAGLDGGTYEATLFVTSNDPERDVVEIPVLLTVGGGVAGEDGALAGAYRLSGAYPNPVSGRARLALEVAEAQAVRVGLYDALGREVARLFDGAVAAGSAHAVEVDASGLAAGVYVVRAVGEAFTATQRLTVLR